MPRTISVRTAARHLDLCMKTVHRLMDDDVFTKRPEVRDRHTRAFLYQDEVELYGDTRDADAVRAYRVRMRRLKPRERVVA